MMKSETLTSKTLDTTRINLYVLYESYTFNRFTKITVKKLVQIYVYLIQ